MRITNQMMFSSSQYDYSKTMQNLYKIDRSISSGTKIQQGYEDAMIYDNTMRLDYDLTTLKQVKLTSQKAQTFANNSDKAMNQMTDILTDVKTKLIKASNSGANSTTSMEAIANDLKGFKNELMNIANTSINGQFLFSGSATDKKPISLDGEYNGNDKQMKAVIGSRVKLPFNVTGSELFMGMDRDYNKIVQTNVQLTNQLNTTQTEYINESSTVKELVGDYEGDSVFYIQGRKPNGDTFTSRFSMTPDSTMEDLLDKIGNEYGNDGINDVVDVSMNTSGQIVIKDNQKGNNELDFFMVAATDPFAAVGDVGAAKVDSLDDFKLPAAQDLKITSFIQGDRSNFDNDAIISDNVKFLKKGNSVTGSTSQVVKGTNRFATDSTKLSEVAGGPLDMQKFTITGKDKNGLDFEVTLNLGNVSTVTIDATDYQIPDNQGNPTKADDLTYRQLNDIVAMAVSNTKPDSNSVADYNEAVSNSRRGVSVELDYRGRMKVTDMVNPSSKIELSIYGEHAGKFADTQTEGSLLSFSQNNAITIDEPYVDIFKDLDRMINAVENSIYQADSSSLDPRNPGIEAALARLDHISDHVSKSHTAIGSFSNALKSAEERSELLSLNIKSIQSTIIDIDIGESYLKLNQLAMNYQAILQATSKINSLSLVNYM